ncbi:hypothetical protein DSO57_1022530 [Entomophthora muscae]|uniref:Uncharacterized protein n=1 Tax=Entomophthora muscae TaxID=34485 RepID=A0ACC2RU97_9FUNG|nr:hypothetical protein DSO57_1022530 [Entomophthora muscae]
MIPVSGPWSGFGGSTTYTFKLAPILWWAQPTSPAACPIPVFDGLFAQEWNHDKNSRKGVTK